MFPESKCHPLATERRFIFTSERLYKFVCTSGRFSDVIEKFVHGQHYAKKQPEFDLYPDAGTFKVKQNDTIAFSGNTGGSTAPHLHFEIRDSKTEHALNPLDFYQRIFTRIQFPLS